MAERILEVCIDDEIGMMAAYRGGAGRLELCSALSIGGLTPTPGLIAAAVNLSIPCYAMIRPRDGDFVYSESEFSMLMREIDMVRRAGVDGVVLGATLPDGRLDYNLLKILTGHSEGLGMTLHRAIDLVPDFDEAVEMAISLGFERILTSGGKRTAPEGVDVLERAIEVAAGRISIMPGSGVNSETIDVLLPRLKTNEIHGSCSVSVPVSNPKVIELGFAPTNPKKTDETSVRALKTKIDAL
ncbi:copper homeostasis protein CutC [Rhizobium sp. NRK18]|jgi:copper homeostasis protein|uniref:copper homeostasis protein CutC n=1 Tax=Rhizobium sp. NRK18 TaxID=2964667 RepID=UPI0021C30118|nr:copper homeostasis protein CutC [Rhizobium sp. NRK18]MCQ2005736.1 copper homeostasis protein CutC [Rhizobium sp. NRK18]